MTVFLLPLPALANKLADCDGKSYNVTITNGGQTRTITLSPMSGEIEEFGSTVSFRLDGQPPVVTTEPYDEYCIWSGKIKIQRRNVGNQSNSGSGFR